MTNNATSPETGKDHRLDALLRHLERLLPEPADAPAFRHHILAAPAPCVRLNPLVPQAEPLRPALERLGQAVPWCPDAFVLPGGDSRLGHCLEFRLGALYIQAKATTLAVEALDPQPGERVLDLAAAPGGKATHTAGRMANTGLVLANDPQSRRVAALVGNLERCGAHNAAVTRAPGTVLARYFHNCFDRVLLDAPCSGDGIVGKDLDMLWYWSPRDAAAKAIQQVGLVRAAFHMLRPGGTLVYSTCSLSTEENEDVILGLLKRFPDQVRVEPVPGFDPVSLPPDLAARYPPEFGRAARIWPHLHHTEGGVVFRLGKSAPTRWPRLEADLGLLLDAVPTAAADRAAGAESVRAALRDHWHLSLDVPPGHELALERKHAALGPAAGRALAGHLPFLVRSGMRLASLHKGHLYLTQQAVQLWGDRISLRRLDLTWPQVQALFRGEAAPLAEESSLRGEVICAFGPWAVCRGLVGGDRRTVQGYLPKALRTPDLERLTGI